MFVFWDWVGGRYSMESAIGLSTMIAIGPERYVELLDGFHAMDEHFRTAPFEENLPVLMGLLAVWNRDFLGCASVGVMPYEQYLKRLPAYLQQLTMESNGKHVTLDGTNVDYDTGARLLGRTGYQRPAQLLPTDPSGHHGHPGRPHRIRQEPQSPGRAPRHPLVERLRPGPGAGLRQDRRRGPRRRDAPSTSCAHRVMEGNRPTNVLLAEVLTPRLLGSLIALYEHSVFTQGTIWGIDSFDQWGVELGKVLAVAIIPELESDTEPTLAPRLLDQ